MITKALAGFAGLLFALAAMGGELVDRKTGDLLKLEVDRERGELEASLIQGDRSFENVIQLYRVNEILDDTQVKLSDVGLFGLPFSRVSIGLEIIDEEEIRNPFLVASAVILPLSLDLFGLPFDLFDGGPENMRINRDVKILRQALEEEEVRKISHKRFQRIAGYLEFTDTL